MHLVGYQCVLEAQCPHEWGGCPANQSSPPAPRVLRDRRDKATICPLDGCLPAKDFLSPAAGQKRALRHARTRQTWQACPPSNVDFAISTASMPLMASQPLINQDAGHARIPCCPCSLEDQENKGAESPPEFPALRTSPSVRDGHVGPAPQSASASGGHLSTKAPALRCAVMHERREHPGATL